MKKNRQAKTGRTETWRSSLSADSFILLVTVLCVCCFFCFFCGCEWVNVFVCAIYLLDMGIWIIMSSPWWSCRNICAICNRNQFFTINRNFEIPTAVNRNTNLNFRTADIWLALRSYLICINFEVATIKSANVAELSMWETADKKKNHSFEINSINWMAVGWLSTTIENVNLFDSRLRAKVARWII